MTLPAYVRISAVAAPALMLLYGVLRFFDGLDGHHDKTGLEWRAGHVAFFLGFVLLGVLMAGAWSLVTAAAPEQRALATTALIASELGAAAFLWVTLGDLFPSFPELPGPLQLVGPLLFEIGALTLLVRLVLAKPRMLPPWAPVAVFAGFLAIALNLELLPLAALIIGAGLVPLAMIDRSRVSA